MRLSRVYVDAPLGSGARVQLTGSAAGHVVRVLRLRAGDAVTLFNGTGTEFAGRIESARGTEVHVLVGEDRQIRRESPLPLTLAQGVSRGERMDMVVQKATELGATDLVPVLTERSVVKLDAAQAARRLTHWRAIAIAACEQSGRNRPPGLTAPQSLKDLLAQAPAEATRLVLTPSSRLRIPDVPPPKHGVWVLIGPEGGLTEEEQERAVAAGFIGVRLGPRILRTETAAFAALTLLQREFGDL
ncbi:MAG: 16S rRNA (uracil(1498)-N(3))-methyltransferase [Proteobacteria bacterium]|nr:16S rRNA (uracil(1498)-N(3))-methyltransferase [Pseudomonadota bacterium]